MKELEKEKHTAHGSEAEPLSDHLGQLGGERSGGAEMAGKDRVNGQLFDSPGIRSFDSLSLSLGLKIRDELLRTGTALGSSV